MYVGICFLVFIGYFKTVGKFLVLTPVYKLDMFTIKTFLESNDQITFSNKKVPPDTKKYHNIFKPIINLFTSIYLSIFT